MYPVTKKPYVYPVTRKYVPTNAKHQLKRKDTVILYATTTGAVGTLVDYSGKRSHTKHSTICVNPSQSPEYQIPNGYHTAGVATSSAILQRILREYSRSSTALRWKTVRKNISKRVVLTGNSSYIHIAADTRFSLNRSDKWCLRIFFLSQGKKVLRQVATAYGLWCGSRVDWR